MKKLLLCCFMIFMLAGCFGENYDVGHPITSIENGGKTFELTPSFVSWSSKSDTTNYDKRQTELELPEIVVHQGEYVNLSFRDRTDKGGEYGESSIKVYSNDNNNETLLYETAITSPYLEELHSFTVPNEAGEYTITVKFSTGNGYAEYIGKLIVQ